MQLYVRDRDVVAKQRAVATSASKGLRLFGVVIANGYSSEVRVAAGLLKSAPRTDAILAVNSWSGDLSTADRIATEAGCEVAAIDMGWRPPAAKAPGLRSKVTPWLRLLTSIPKLVRLAREFRPDVIYSSQQVPDCVAALIVASLLGMPHVVHLHYLPGPWLRSVPSWRLRHCAAVIAVSEFIRREAVRAGTPFERAVTVENPALLPPVAADDRSRAPLREEFGISHDTIIVGTAGRFTPWKGQREALEAFCNVARSYDNVVLFMVGDGEVRSELEEIARHRGLHERVIFTGWRDDISRILDALDIFIHPSHNEPFGLAVLEAQTAGLPVVAFDEGGIPEIVIHGRTGLLAANRDVGELTRDLERLVTDASLRRRMGAAAREHATATFDALELGARFQSALKAATSRPPRASHRLNSELIHV
jgi:glycosyltransferase involved in cell wall biosynthesis